MKGASSTGKAGGAPQPAEVRQAENGQYYTAAQFMDFYDDEAAQKWKEAAARATASASGDEGDTPQLAVDSHALARPCICTLQDIAKLTPEPNMGGKVAYAKQKELRAKCLDEGLWEIDVSDSWPQWRQVLRAMNQRTMEDVIGDGIVSVTFRLLENVQDPNYYRMKDDPGERHVFEVVRVDTSAMHLHYHSNGSLDNPPYFRPKDGSSDAPQPTVPNHPPNPSAPKIGRKEYAAACTALVKHCWGKADPPNVGAVDITDGKGFDWRRYINNIKEGEQVDETVISNVFVMSYKGQEDSPQLAFAEANGTWRQLSPEKGSKLETQEENWHEVPFFLRAKTVSHSWMRLQ